MLRKQAYLHGLCVHVFERERDWKSRQKEQKGVKREGGAELFYVGYMEKERKWKKDREGDLTCERTGFTQSKSLTSLTPDSSRVII